MADRVKDFQATVNNFNVSDEPQPEPELTQEQKDNLYILVTPDLCQLQVTEVTGEQILLYTRALFKTETFNLTRIVNSIYQFLTTSEIGQYRWLGHTQPIIFRTKPGEDFKTIISFM